MSYLCIVHPDDWQGVLDSEFNAQWTVTEQQERLYLMEQPPYQSVYVALNPTVERGYNMNMELPEDSDQLEAWIKWALDLNLVKITP